MNAARAVEQYAHDSPTIRVTFTDPDEFAQEIKQRGPNVEPVVRATLRWTPDSSGAPFYNLALAATYLRRLPEGVLSLVELNYDVGPVWGGLDHAESRLHREQPRQGRRRSTVVVPILSTGSATPTSRRACCAAAGSERSPWRWSVAAFREYEPP